MSLHPVLTEKLNTAVAPASPFAMPELDVRDGI